MRKKYISRMALNGARLIATVSSFALTGSAFAASEATWEFYRSLNQQARVLPAECYDESGNLVITPQNVELCSALPTAAVGLAPPDTENGNDRGDDDSFGDDDVVSDDDEPPSDDEGDDGGEGGEGDDSEGDDSDDDDSDDDSEGSNNE